MLIVSCTLPFLHCHTFSVGFSLTLLPSHDNILCEVPSFVVADEQLNNGHCVQVNWSRNAPGGKLHLNGKVYHMVQVSEN